MGQLTEATFEAAVAACPACGGRELELDSFIDRRLHMMLGEPNDAGRWVHDGEKFVDGTYRIACASCRHVVFESAVCPRCNAPDGLARARADGSRLTVPRRCPGCAETELLALALIPARARYAGGKTAAPTPQADFGEAGYHVVAFACEACDAATVTQACPLCDAPGPLRPRP
ncbi:MAG: hypothetical protein R2939_07400 [Kofleriaceae bacterium]